MTPTSSALELGAGTRVSDHYVVERTLGRGGFAITYLASGPGGRMVALKELAPPGSTRGPHGEMILPVQESVSDHRMRHQFLREAKLLARLRIPGVVQVLDVFQFGGTAYYAMEYLEDAVTLEWLLRSAGCFHPERARKLLHDVALTLEQVHAEGYLHRDIKPSNILVAQDDRPVLIDFGSAREWHADATVSHTTLFTPGYAPIEQLSETGRRGPATDVYSVAATGYEMLAGQPPPSAVDRVAGAPVPPLPEKVPARLAAAILKGLALKATDRPGSGGEFAEMLSHQAATAVVELSEIERMDRAIAALHTVKIRRNECPACEDVLEEPRPLKDGVCPVCWAGKLRPRRLEMKLCALCRAGVLREVRNLGPLVFCPICRLGRLERQGFLSRKRFACRSCKAAFRYESRHELTLLKLGAHQSDLVDEGQTGSETDFWLHLSGRSERVLACETCKAEWDVRGDEMTLAVHAEDPYGIAAEHKVLSAEEWARLAARLPLDAGNVYCQACSADFFVENDRVTLIDAPSDPNRFLSRYQGRLLPAEHIRWLGVGKSSGAAGFICSGCDTELDFDGDYLRLRYTTHDALRRHVDTARPLEDWKRIAMKLPTRDEEPAFFDRFMMALRREVIEGGIPWDGNEGWRWRGPARRLDEDGRVEARGKLTILDGRVDLDARSKSLSLPLDAMIEATAEGEVVNMRFAGQAAPVAIAVEPVELRIELTSGTYEVILVAEDFAEIAGSLRAANSRASRTV